MSSRHSLRVGVVGAGGMGTRHAHNLSGIPGVRVVAVADPDLDRAGEVAVASGSAVVLDDPEALISHPDVEAVVIASPDHTHAPLALACVRAGRPALVEKPLGTSPEEALEVVRAEERAGRRLLQVGFMRVYDPAHAELRRLVESGAVGEPTFATLVHTNRKAAARTLDEVVVQSAIHDLHSARFLLASDIEEVFCRVLPGDEAGAVRGVLVSARLQGGLLASIVMDAESASGYEVSAEVTGTGGSASLRDPVAVTLRSEGTSRSPIPQDWLARFVTAYEVEAAAWVEGIRRGEPFGPNAWEGYAAAAAAEACIRSAANGLPRLVDMAGRAGGRGAR